MFLYDITDIVYSPYYLFMKENMQSSPHTFTVVTALMFQATPKSYWDGSSLIQCLETIRCWVGTRPHTHAQYARKII